MIEGLMILLAFQCVGEALTFFYQLPVPAPVIGMVLLFLVLCAAPALRQRLEVAATQLLNHLSLLFVPAGVGVVAVASAVQGHWLGVIAAMVGSTLLTLTTTALVMSGGLLLQRRLSGIKGGSAEVAAARAPATAASLVLKKPTDVAAAAAIEVPPRAPTAAPTEAPTRPPTEPRHPDHG
ncbi:MAG: CidA/LrgA family protein [Janthinobacterium lividum]